MPTLKAKIIDENGVRRALMRISHEICEANKGIDDIILVGVKRRGVPLANMICENLERIEGVRVPVFELDITFYRDDLEKMTEIPSYRQNHEVFQVNGKKVIIVDDVIYTGRTARAAQAGR